jgi:hypothetical protein
MRVVKRPVSSGAQLLYLLLNQTAHGRINAGVEGNR